MLCVFEIPSKLPADFLGSQWRLSRNAREPFVVLSHDFVYFRGFEQHSYLAKQKAPDQRRL